MAKPHHYGLILAGGRGTRFWPRSRKRHAKQVLTVTGERSLIQDTVERLKPVIPPERIWILTNTFIRDEIVRQLPEVPPGQVLAEPAQRNTAAAIGLAAHILRSVDPEAVFGVFPSDHIIGQPKKYLKLLKPAFRAAEKGRIAVLGIAPRWPETGYGYIEFPKGTQAGASDVEKVRRFCEKPELPQAKKFLKAGHFFWNAGMFFWKAETLLDELRRHLPKTATLLSSLAAALSEAFPRCEDISIDHAVLEHSDKVVGIACGEFGWNDVGSWNAVYDLMDRDADENASKSELLSADASGNYVDCGGKLVALIGVKNLIVVDTPDALLIADRERAQHVGDIVKLLEKAGRDDLL
jgi:mannose-1-phosphate guanylyltransferase